MCDARTDIEWRPSPNEFESQAIAALKAIGVKNPDVLEHGFKSAMVGGAFECRIALLHSYGTDTPQEPN
jgi:hypothetical protein